MLKSGRWLVWLLLVVMVPYVYGEKISVGTFKQESRVFYSTKDGLPSDKVSVVVDLGGHVIVGTDKGVAVFGGQGWNPVSLVPEKQVVDIASNSSKLGILVKAGEGHELYILADHSLENKIEIPQKYKIMDQAGVLQFGENGYLAASNDLFEFSLNDKKFKPKSLKMPLARVNEVCVDAKALWIAADKGLMKYSSDSKSWENIYPIDGAKSWAPINVHGVAADLAGNIWFASPQGVGRFDGKWKLFTDQEGLPFNDFTIASSSSTRSITGVFIANIPFP